MLLWLRLRTECIRWIFLGDQGLAMNPRWNAYLRLTNVPTTWGFMEFISSRLLEYGKEIGQNPDRFGLYRVWDQDDFTRYIERRVKELAS